MADLHYNRQKHNYYIKAVLTKTLQTIILEVSNLVYRHCTHCTQGQIIVYKIIRKLDKLEVVLQRVWSVFLSVCTPQNVQDCKELFG